MPNRCFVPNCKTGYPSNKPASTLSLFAPPKDKAVFKQWEQYIPRKDIKLKPSSRVCSRHFEEDDVIKGRMIKGKDGKEIFQFIDHGCGKMAQALAKGFIASGITRSENIIGSSPRIDSMFIEEFSAIGCSTTHENAQVVEQADVIIVATKPPLVPKVLTEINPVVNSDNLIVSIAMGIPLINLEQMLPRKTRVIRVMPNTPVLVRSGASVFSCGTSTRSEDATLTKRLFTAVGLCEEVPEVLIDACTGLSGSGPAYMYIAMEALADGGVKMGIPRDLAYKLSAQTLIGAAKMVLETGRHPGALKDDVCSPAGSTIQAVYFLEKSGFRSSLMEAVQAATLKSKQTGRKE